MNIERQPATDVAIESYRLTIHGKKNIEVNHICHLPRSERTDPKSCKKIIIASILCVLLMICETTAGIISNSLSLILDAAHLLVDFAGFMIALFAIWIAKRPPSQQMNFGWHRAEVIATLYVVVIIWFLVATLAFTAVKRIMSSKYAVNSEIMMTTAALSIVVNFFLGLQLRYNTDPQLHRYLHDRRLGRFIHRLHNVHNIRSSKDDTYYKRNTEKAVQTSTSQIHLNTSTTNCNQRAIKKESNLKVLLIGILADTAQSMAVLLIGIIIYINSNWSLADIILTFMFVILIMITTFGILRDALLMLMESTPSFINYDEIVTTLLNIKGVHDVHNLRIWALNMHKIACNVHLDVEPDADANEILNEANNAIHKRFHFFETTIQIDQ